MDLRSRGPGRPAGKGERAGELALDIARRPQETQRELGEKRIPRFGKNPQVAGKKASALKRLG